MDGWMNTGQMIGQLESNMLDNSGQTGSSLEGRTDRPTDKQGLMNGRMDGQLDEQMESGWISGQGLPIELLFK